jgi:hypothetical protein
MMMSTIRVNIFGGKGRSPIVLVPKKNGTRRMCGDFRDLSNITIKNHYSLIEIDDLFDQLQHARFLTKLDL